MCTSYYRLCFFFFFQAEDGIRDRNVTGVQTCALPISWGSCAVRAWRASRRGSPRPDGAGSPARSAPPAARSRTPGAGRGRRPGPSRWRGRSTPGRTPSTGSRTPRRARRSARSPAATAGHGPAPAGTARRSSARLALALAVGGAVQGEGEMAGDVLDAAAHQQPTGHGRGDDLADVALETGDEVLGSAERPPLPGVLDRGVDVAHVVGCGAVGRDLVGERVQRQIGR